MHLGQTFMFGNIGLRRKIFVKPIGFSSLGSNV